MKSFSSQKLNWNKLMAPRKSLVLDCSHRVSNWYKVHRICLYSLVQMKIQNSHDHLLIRKALGDICWMLFGIFEDAHDWSFGINCLKVWIPWGSKIYYTLKRLLTYYYLSYLHLTYTIRKHSVSIFYSVSAFVYVSVIKASVFSP